MQRTFIRIAAIVLLSITGFGVLSTAHAACPMTFAVQGGQTYADSQFTNFIDTEVRPQLTKNQKSFTIELDMACPNASAQSLLIVMDASDYYITALSSHP